MRTAVLLPLSLLSSPALACANAVEGGLSGNDIVGIAILSLSVGVVVFAVTATPILVYLYRRTA